MREIATLEERLEPAFIALAESVEDWSQKEVAQALLNLAVARSLMLNVNDDTQSAIDEAVRQVHGLTDQ